MAQDKTRKHYDIMHPLFNAMKKHKLASTDRLFLLGLYRFVDGNGEGYPSYKALMDETGLSNKTIATCIKRLTDSGWITYEKGNNLTHTNNTYQLNLEKIGITQPQQADVIPINQPKAQYIALDGTAFDYPTAMHEHNAKLRQSK